MRRFRATITIEVHTDVPDSPPVLTPWLHAEDSIQQFADEIEGTEDVTIRSVDVLYHNDNGGST